MTSDWLDVLRRECARSSQSAVARRLGKSQALISLLLAGKYTRDTSRIEAAVRSRLLPATVSCPVLGEIDGATCLDWRTKELASTSSFRTRMWRACRGCKHNPQRGEPHAR